jgi:hypothetical protein
MPRPLPPPFLGTVARSEALPIGNTPAVPT